VTKRILITGGAGFIGSHLAKTLLRQGHSVRILDNLLDQVHRGGQMQTRLPAEIEIVVGDVRDEDAVDRALRGIEQVVHLAAEVGVGQSMYEIERYVSVNDVGTAVLMQHLSRRPVERIVVASSMSIYGEGLYRDSSGRIYESVRRGTIRPGDWDPRGEDGAPLTPVPTPEWKRADLASVYALTKYSQEQMVLNVAAAYGMPAVALRLFNVYGPGQALSNPYTGVLAIFASRLLNGNAPVIFEDGLQRRDFVHVEDVAQAFASALSGRGRAGQSYNIASGADRSIREVAQALSRAMGRSIEPDISGRARTGDIRHCIADISLATRELGFKPRRDFEEGLAELAEWVSIQIAEDRVPEARRELEARGLVS
jgi:dTDP-L-rhamnose 4-epimerase